jgi:hypothetical protein
MCNKCKSKSKNKNRNKFENSTPNIGNTILETMLNIVNEYGKKQEHIENSDNLNDILVNLKDFVAYNNLIVDSRTESSVSRPFSIDLYNLLPGSIIYIDYLFLETTLSEGRKPTKELVEVYVDYIKKFGNLVKTIYLGRSPISSDFYLFYDTTRNKVLEIYGNHTIDLAEGIFEFNNSFEDLDIVNDLLKRYEKIVNREMGLIN